MIALENEAYRMVAVGIPVAVGKFLCGRALDYKVARGIFVKPADNVQKRGFSAPRSTEYGNKLVFAEVDAYAFKRLHGAARHLIFLFNIY